MSKSYSRRFKSSAEFVERTIGLPAVNTVERVGRKTGVDKGIRWVLETPMDSTSHSSKEKKENGREEDDSRDKMPLRYCLTWPRWANERLEQAITSLKRTLDELEEYKRLSADEKKAANVGTSIMFLRRIEAIKEDALCTLKYVVGIVSKYAGAVLPASALSLIARHLVSLPKRFLMTSSSSSITASVGQNRALVLAREWLDILSQVTDVVNNAIVSTEEWCDALARKPPHADGQLQKESSEQESGPGTGTVNRVDVN